MHVIVLYRDQQSVASPNKVKQKDSNSKVTAILVLAKSAPQKHTLSLLVHATRAVFIIA